MKLSSCSIVAAAALLAAFTTSSSAPQQGPPATPTEIVTTYNSLADAILAVKKTEHDLVMAMLAGTYRHAEAKVQQALGKIGAGQPAKDELEASAALVSQMGNEGDAAVAAVRKRLLEGGHHHNAAGEQQGIFDEGFVIVTKAAKKAFLDSAVAIGKLAGAPNAQGLTAEWAKVKATWESLAKGGR
jgi:hypothetical protein